MQTYAVEINIHGANGAEWVNRGQIKGRSMRATLKRAFIQNLEGIFERQTVRENTVFTKLGYASLRITQIS